MLDKTKLPALSVSIVEDYFQKIDNVSFDAVFLLVQFCISRMLCSNRVKIYNEKHKINTFPNMYCLTIGGSGNNKDKHRKIFDRDLIPFFHEDMIEQEIEFRKQKEFLLSAEAEKEGMKALKASSYVKDNMPRRIDPPIIGRLATPEGTEALHEALAEAKFGALIWRDSEVSDTFLNYRRGSNIDHVITMVKEAYDGGELLSKVIKSNKNIKKLEDIPYMVWLHGALDQDRRQELFKNFLNGGYGRRMFIYIIPKKEENNKTIEEEDANLEAALKEEPAIKKFLEEIYKRTRKNINCQKCLCKDCICNRFTLTPEAEREYMIYKKLCENRSVKLSDFTSNIINDELANRSWKMIKLACVFAVQESSENVITLKHVQQAEYVCEYYSQFLANLLDLNSSFGIAEQMINSLEKEGRMKKTDFYKKNYFPKFASGQPKIFDEQIRIAQEIVEYSGRMIVETKRGVTSFYEIIKIPTEDEEIEVLAYINENGVTSCLTLDVLINKFGGVVRYIIDKHKIQKRTDGGYYNS